MRAENTSKPTTTSLTVSYIKEHAEIRNCLRKGLINYSSLARHIAKEKKIEKKTSVEAIIVAARRFQQKLKEESNREHEILGLILNSEIEIKNKVCVLILNHNIDLQKMDNIQNKVRNNNDALYLIECSYNYTVIVQEKYLKLFHEIFKNEIIWERSNLSMIKLISSKEIEEIIGVISYITNLFSEHGVNIVEFISSWTDTICVIDTKDVNRAIEFLRF